MSINWQEILFNFLGGLGLFLYSIKTMGEGLQQAAGDRLRYYIDKYTSNPFLGVLVGIVVTALIQSSTGVTVITAKVSLTVRYKFNTARSKYKGTGAGESQKHRMRCV